MASPLTTAIGVCAFVYHGGDRPPVFDRSAGQLLAATVASLEIDTYCEEENRPISTVLSYEGRELIVIGVRHREHTVVVAWHTPLFCELLSIIQAQNYGGNGPDALRNKLTAGIPIYNPKAPLGHLHVFANYPLGPLVRSFSYDGLRLLLSLAASGKSIVFVGEKLSTPSLCCFGLRAALQPLDWLGLFAPVCDPSSIAGTILNEVAMVGTRSSAVPSLLLSNKRDTFIANCTTGAIAPTAGAAIVYTFPPSEKLKTSLGEGSDMAEGIFNYWATHCIGQYRKGLAGRAFDPFKCLFPTTAGSSRERLAKNVSCSPAFGRWLRHTVEHERSSKFTDYCARQFPDLYPEHHKSKSSLGLGIFARAKQTLRSITTDVDVRLPQYMTSPQVFGCYVSSDSSANGPFFGSPPAGAEHRLPLDCLINFEAYHALLTPARPSAPAEAETPAPEASAEAVKMPPPPHSPPRRTGMSMIRDGPPKVFTVIAEAPSAASPEGAARSPRPAPMPTEAARQPMSSEPLVTASPPPAALEAHKAVLDLAELRAPTPPPPAAPFPVTPNIDNHSLVSVPIATAPTAAEPQQQAAPLSPPPQPAAAAGKYDAFAELEKVAVAQQMAATPPAAEPTKFEKLEDFF